MSFDPRFTLTLSKNDILLTKQMSAEIVKNVQGRDRKDPRADEDISPHGIGGEILNVRLYSHWLEVDAEEKLRLWQELRSSGSNYGMDILACIFEIKKDTETKITKWYGTNLGYLYMRPKSGDLRKFGLWEINDGIFDKDAAIRKAARAKMLEYWTWTLPDCYYTLFVDRYPTYHFVAWSTKKKLLADYSLWLNTIQNSRMSEGKPTIGVLHTYALRPEDLMKEIVKSDKLSV